MDFKEWLAGRPYAGLLSEGTIKLMESAWDASREQLATLPFNPEQEPVGRVLSGPRGDIND